MHGLGPHNITVGGRQTTVRQELKETYSAIEEAKADISSLFAIQYMIDKGTLPKSLERPLYTTFLASTFRSIRFGINEAHGRGIAIQLNYLMDKGAVNVRADGTFAVDILKAKEAVTGLTHDIMTLQAEGNYAPRRICAIAWASCARRQAALDKMAACRLASSRASRPPISSSPRQRFARSQVIIDR
jgi:hypothetical protein